MCACMHIAPLSLFHSLPGSHCFLGPRIVCHCHCRCRRRLLLPLLFVRHCPTYFCTLRSSASIFQHVFVLGFIYVSNGGTHCSSLHVRLHIYSTAYIQAYVLYYIFIGFIFIAEAMSVGLRHTPQQQKPPPQTKHLPLLLWGIYR